MFCHCNIVEVVYLYSIHCYYLGMEKKLAKVKDLDDFLALAQGFM